MKKFAKLTIIAIVALWFVGTANASMITGEILMRGLGKPLFDLSTADSVPPPFATFVSDATGDFPDSLIGDAVSFVGFTFKPVFNEVDPLWSVGGFTFKLESILVLRQTADELKLVGSGILQHNSFDNTPGNWFMDITPTTDEAYFKFFSGRTAAVPEASIMMLLGTGLIGVAFYTRRRK